MQARLICRPGTSRVKQFELRQLPSLLGRGERADVRLDDRWVSRRHCQITEQDGVLVVKDLGSTHGTWLNQQRVAQADLHPGDELGIGLTTLRVDYEECHRP